jgi:hypothetical protein
MRVKMEKGIKQRKRVENVNRQQLKLWDKCDVCLRLTEYTECVKYFYCENRYIFLLFYIWMCSFILFFLSLSTNLFYFNALFQSLDKYYFFQFSLLKKKFNFQI